MDPDEEKRLQKEKEKQMKKDVPMIKLKAGTVIPSTMITATNASANGMTTD